jgi:hypothetical protein
MLRGHDREEVNHDRLPCVRMSLPVHALLLLRALTGW